MTFRLSLIAGAALLAALAAPQATRAQDFTPVQRGAIEKIVHDYLVSHPEVLQEAMAELDKKQTAEDAQKHLAVAKVQADRNQG